MRKYIVALALVSSFLGFCQDTVTAGKAKDFIGKQVILKGKIA